jgi:hypothetical protein
MFTNFNTQAGIRPQQPTLASSKLVAATVSLGAPKPHPRAHQLNDETSIHNPPNPFTPATLDSAFGQKSGSELESDSDIESTDESDAELNGQWPII